MARSSIGSTTTPFTGSSKGLFSFSVTPSGTLQAGHRLLWIYTFASSNNQSVTLYVQFGGTTSNTASGGTTAALSKSDFCTTAPASAILDKQVDKLVAAPGDSLAYTIRFGNAGGTNMTSSQVVDTLPNGVTFTSATLNGSAVSPASTSGQQYTFSVRSSDTATAGQLTAGQSGTLVLNASVSSPFTGASGTLTNTAALTSTQTSQISDAITTTLLRPSVSIAKSASDTSLVPGNSVTYTLQVLNAGPGAASNVTVSDVLPATAYYTYVAGSAKLNGVTIAPDPVSGSTLTKNIGSLAAGAVATVTYTMAVASSGVPNGVTTRSNTATVSDAGTSGSRSSNTVTATISTNPNLSLAKTSAPASGPIAAGSSIVYTLTLTNTGSGTASNVLVEDAIPSNTSFSAGTLAYGGSARTDVQDGDNAYYDPSGGRVVFDVGSLAAGASQTMTYTVRVASPLPNGTTTIGATATATSSNAPTRTATASIQASAAPVLTLTKSAPSAMAFPLTTLAAAATASTSIVVASASALSVGSVISVGGTTATVTAMSGTTITLGTAVTAASGSAVVPTWEYVLQYANTGTAAASAVAVQDVLPAGLAFISADSGGVNGSGTVTWAVGAVAAGGSGTLRVRVRPSSAGSYTNSATLASTELPLVTSNATSTAVGSLDVSKSTTTPNASTSGNTTTATYVITLTNQSPTVAATNITVTDVLPAGFSYASTTSVAGATAATSPSAGDTQPAWSGLSLAAGATATITFVARINNVPAGTYQNDLAVTSSGVSALTFDALATTAEDVTIAAVLGSTGVLSATASIAAGGSVAISVTDADLNTDPSSAQTLQVTVVNLRTSESESVALTETGASTGVFTGTLATVLSPLGGSNNSGAMNVAALDTLRTSYGDALTSTGSTATLTADTGVVVLSSAPVVTTTGSALAYLENAGAVAIDTGLTVTDADSANLAGATVTISANYVSAQDSLGFAAQNGITGSFSSATGVLTLSGSSSVANYQAALRSVTYTNSSDAPSTATRTVSFAASDGTLTSNTATRAITVTAVNDNPTAVNDSATVAEDSAATAVNVLTNDSALPDVGETLSIASVTQGASGGVVTITGGGTGLTYAPAANFNGIETFTYTIGDGNGGTATATVTMTVTAANDPPIVITTPSSLTYAEGDGAVAFDAGLTVGDPDSVTLAGATVTIGGFVAGADVLAFTDQSGISGAFDTTSGVLTLAGTATLAQYEAALRTITFANSTVNPAATGRTITVIVNDGALASAPASRGMTVSALPRPSIDQPADVTVDEDSGVATRTLTGIAPATAGGAVSLAVQAADASLFGALSMAYTDPSSTASLSFTPAANAFGSTLVTITVTPVGGPPARPTAKTVQVTVAPVNDPPTLDVVADRPGVIGVAQSVSLAGIGTGAPNEVQTLTLTASSSNTAVVPNPTVVYASPGSNGTLSFTPAAAGTAIVTITVNDGGSTNAATTRTFRVAVASPVNTPPTITRIADVSVVEGHPLPPVSFTIGDADTPASQLQVTWQSSNGALLPQAAVTVSGTGAARTMTLANVPGRIGASTITITVSDGTLTASTAFVARVRPRWDYYLADGSAVPGSMTDVRITNPHDVHAPISVTFLKPDGTLLSESYDLAPRSRHSLRLSDIAAAGGGEASTVVRSEDDLPLLVERTMLWDRSAYAGSAETALESTNLRWYFADGAQGVQQTYLLLANPNDQAADVTVTFLPRDGAPATRAFSVGPTSRRTVPLGSVPELTGREFGMIVDSSLPIAAERTMYFAGPAGRAGGSTAAGVPYPSTRWYFAEGSDWKIFLTYVLLLNPGSNDANVHIAYHTMDGRHFATDHVVRARTRVTVDTLAAEPRLDGQHYWMEVTSDVPVVAERTMFWDRGSALMESHSSHGVLEASTRWSTGDARVGGAQAFSTFVLIANPTDRTATLRLTVKRDGGGDIVTTREIPPMTRDTVNVAKVAPTLTDESFWVVVESTNGVPVVVERSVYWNPTDRGGWSGGTNVFALPIVAADYDGCTFSVSPRTFTAPAPGARLRFSVGATTRCTYSTSSNAPWLTIVSGASGSGVSDVELRAAPNATGAARVGTITVAGTTVVVTQAAGQSGGPGDPVLVIDRPAPESRVGQAFWVAGWTADRAALDGTSGIDIVDVWAYPNPGSGAAPIFLGTASYGIERPDVEAALGEQARRSGFGLHVQGLAAGRYMVVAFGHSTVTGTFNIARSVNVVVTSEPHMVIDLPRPGRLAQPGVVAGWVLDAANDEGPGIDAVHVWAYPNPGSSAAPIFMGVAGYGIARPDVAAYFGARFVNSGFALALPALEPNRYRLVVFARRAGAPGFDIVQYVDVDVATSIAGGFSVAQDASVVRQPFTIDGWASNTGTGGAVTGVDLYAQSDGGLPVLLGAADYGGAGSQFRYTVRGQAPGRYAIVAKARIADGSVAEVARTSVTFVNGARIVLDAPPTIVQGASVAGWAFDDSATTGTGVDVVHVWAYPAAAGAAPIFVGVAPYGAPRLDVAAVYGSAYRDTGFAFTADGMATGRYTLVAFAHSTETGQFSVSAARTVDVIAR